MKLMIVDDHAGMRSRIRDLLARPNVETREYGTGEEAIEAAREFQPDWIIMDVHLSGVNGIEAAKTIRSDVPRARIVVISTEDRGYLREAAREGGAEEFLSKHQLADLPHMLYGGPAGPPAWQRE
jgi:DNA-binding NarL/FixJ family response regulator